MAATLPRTLGPEALRVAKDSARILRELKKVDPRDRYVVLIPDSDRAHLGMGFKLLNNAPAEQVYERASDIVNKDLLKLCLDGPRSELYGSKEMSNLATFVTSHATLEKLRHEQPEKAKLCKSSGGVGVGLINSLVFGGAMTFEDGLDLARRQGQAMDRAAQIVPSARLKVRLLPATNKRRLCLAAVEHCVKMGLPEEIAVCNITKQLHAHVVEIAGHEEAIRYLETDGGRLFKFRWISRVSRTPQAFHTQLMKPAEDFLRGYIEQRLKKNPEYIKEPLSCSAHSSNSGARVRSVRQIKKDLITYPVRPVLVEQMLHLLYSRPKTVPQPNTIVLWDRNLLDTLENVNRLAREQAKLYV